jgi:hypothetical protein
MTVFFIAISIKKYKIRLEWFLGAISCFPLQSFGF